MTDISHLEFDGIALKGTLGEAFFRRTWTQIDYPRRTVRMVAEESPKWGLQPDCSQTGEKLEARGARGSFEARTTEIGSVRVGGFERTAVEAVLSESMGPILIGNGFLKDFVLTVDYPGDQICLASQ